MSGSSKLNLKSELPEVKTLTESTTSAPLKVVVRDREAEDTNETSEEEDALPIPASSHAGRGPRRVILKGYEPNRGMSQARFNGVFDGDKDKWADFRFLFVEWVRTFQTPEYAFLEFLEKSFETLLQDIEDRIPAKARADPDAEQRLQLREEVFGYRLEEDRRQLMRTLVNSLRGNSSQTIRSCAPGDPYAIWQADEGL